MPRELCPGTGMPPLPRGSVRAILVALNLIAPSLRRRLGWLCVLVACLLGHPAGAAPSVDEQLEAIAQMPAKAHPEALKSLAALRRTLPERDVQRLEVLWQLAGIHNYERNAEALLALEPEFGAWIHDPEPTRAALGRLAWQLALEGMHWGRRDLAKANAALAAVGLTPAEEERLPPVWRLRWFASRADLAEEVGKLDDAMELRLIAMRAAEKTESPRRIAGAMNSLANVHRRKGDSEQARHWSDQALALALAKVPSNEALLSNIYLTQGTILTDQERYSEAAAAYEKVLALADRDQDLRTRALMLGNLADLGLRNKDYPRAFKLASEAHKLALETKDRGNEALAMHNMGVAQIAMGKVDEGRGRVLQAIQIERDDGNVTSVAEGLHELGEYLERAGDLAGAVKAYTEYRGLADTLERDDRRKAVVEAQQKYDDDRKNAEREALIKANELNGALAEARRLQLALWGLLLACGVAGVALLLNLSRRTRDANRELAKSNEVLAEQSERDPLTGLGNRHQLQRLLAEPRRAKGSVGSLFLVDVDHFKQINDTHGHAGGDQVLVELAERLRQAVRDGDAVLRWGGEEFLVLTDAQDGAAARALAQRVLASIASTPVTLADGSAVPVSVSMGFARFPLPEVEGVVSWEAALELVDQLMYRAKSHGRNQAWSLESAPNARADDLLALLAEAEAAVQRGAIELGQWRGPALVAGGTA